MVVVVASVVDGHLLGSGSGGSYQGSGAEGDELVVVVRSLGHQMVMLVLLWLAVDVSVAALVAVAVVVATVVVVVSVLVAVATMLVVGSPVVTDVIVAVGRYSKTLGASEVLGACDAGPAQPGAMTAQLQSSTAPAMKGLHLTMNPPVMRDHEPSSISV